MTEQQAVWATRPEGGLVRDDQTTEQTHLKRVITSIPISLPQEQVESL